MKPSSAGNGCEPIFSRCAKAPSGPQIIASRTHPGLVERLFEMEVPEIYEGIIEIKGARESPMDAPRSPSIPVIVPSIPLAPA